jgi:hypothetical protein
VSVSIRGSVDPRLAERGAPGTRPSADIAHRASWGRAWWGEASDAGPGAVDHGAATVIRTSGLDTPE